MNVVIIGGHDHMVSQHKKICRSYKCKAKAFTQMSASLGRQTGNPDLLVLFANTVSHEMIRYAPDEVGNGVEIAHCHANNGTALTEILEERCAVCAL